MTVLTGYNGFIGRLSECSTRRFAMITKEIEVIPKGDLIVEQEMLRAAGLTGRLRLIVQSGEIRVLPGLILDSLKKLEELAGCLGRESATEYDFQLKIGGLYEAR